MYQPYLNPDHTPPSLRLPWIGPVRPWRLILLAALVAGCVGVYSCYRGRVAFRSVSPEGKRAIVLKEYRVGAGIPLQYFRIELLAEEQGRQTVVYRSNEKWFFEFAAAHWASNSKVVDLLACNLESSDLLLRYEFSTGRVVELDDRMGEALSRAIEDEYSADYAKYRGSLTPLQWACATPGRDAFTDKHPEWAE